MTGIELWSTTAASNNSAAPNGWPEGMPPSGVNDTGRQMMAATREWYENAEWINLGHTPTYIGATQFSVTGDKTTTYQVGRRVKAYGTTPFTIYGTISASAYASVTTVTVTWDSGSLNGTLTTVWVGSASVTNPSIYTSAISGLSTTLAGRTLQDNDGITWTNPAGVAGNPTPNISAQKSIWIPATAMRPCTATACAALTDNAFGGFYTAPSLDFDATLDEAAGFVLSLPNGWDKAALQFRVYWSHPATTTNFVVRWVLGGNAVSNDEALGAATIAQGAVNDTGGTTDDLYITDKTTLTISSPVNDDMMLMQIVRNGSNGADTLAVDARLHGIMIYYTINTLSDS